MSLAISTLSRSQRIAIVTLICCALTFPQLLRLGVTVSIAQVAVIPFVAIAATMLLSISPIITAIALIIGVGTNLALLIRESDVPGNVEVAELVDDPFGKKTRKLTEALSEEAGNVNVRRIDQPLKTFSEAEQYYSGKHPKSVIWGNHRWVNIYSGPFETKSISEFRAHYPSVKLVTTLPVFGLSVEPTGDTAKFISRFLSLNEAGDRYEIELKSLTTMRSLWSSNSHLGFMMWKLGNHYIEDAYDKDFEPRNLECAIAAYRAALSFLPNPKTHPQLYAAIFNNFAVADYLSKLEGIKKSPRRIRKVKKALRRVAKISQVKDPFGMSNLILPVVVNNLHAINVERGIKAKRLLKLRKKGGRRLSKIK